MNLSICTELDLIVAFEHPFPKNCQSKHAPKSSAMDIRSKIVSPKRSGKVHDVNLLTPDCNLDHH